MDAAFKIYNVIRMQEVDKFVMSMNGHWVDKIMELIEAELAGT